MCTPLAYRVFIWFLADSKHNDNLFLYLHWMYFQSITSVTFHELVHVLPSGNVSLFTPAYLSVILHGAEPFILSHESLPPRCVTPWSMECSINLRYSKETAYPHFDQRIRDVQESTLSGQIGIVIKIFMNMESMLSKEFNTIKKILCIISMECIILILI